MIGRKIWVVLLTLLMAGSAFCALPCAFGESAEPLYESTFEDQVQGLPAGWSFGEGSYSQEASVSGGRLILDGTASNTKPTSAMLSDITGADLSVELDMTISDASDSGRWAGVILRSGTGGALRVQFKSDASAASGITIAELRADGTISRTVKLASAQAFDPEKLYRVRVAVLGKAVAVYVDGGLVTVAEGLNATIAEGQVGLCAVGCKLQADTVRVEVLASLPDLEDVSGLNSPTYTASAVSVTPVLATPVYSAEQARAAEDGQLLEVRIGANLSVLDRDGRPSCDIGSLLSAIGKRYIPVFTPVDASAASALAGYLNARNVTDAFIRSADAGIVSAVREACPMLSGILDLSGQSVSGEERQGDSAIGGLGDGRERRLAPETADDCLERGRGRGGPALGAARGQRRGHVRSGGLCRGARMAGGRQRHGAPAARGGAPWNAQPYGGEQRARSRCGRRRGG